MQKLTIEESKLFDERNRILIREYSTFVGKKIQTIRPLTKAECEDLAWEYDDRYQDFPAFVIIFDDGQALIPSRDPEGNGPGFLITGDC
jgi:hypothetical protein